MKKVEDPLNFGECGSEGSVFGFGRATTHGRLFGAFPGDNIGTKEDAEPCRGPPVIRIIRPIRVCKH
ncbi:hypothetical protein PIB30_075194, partial [Stylosanthes scabra]|nr:hypothetical protein [Stylosanthes scabra]